MSYILLLDKRCPACNKAVDSSSGTETWHESCWQAHKGKGCTSHDVCKRAMKEGW